MSCLVHAPNILEQDILSILKVAALTTKDKEEMLYSQIIEYTFTNSTYESR